MKSKLLLSHLLAHSNETFFHKPHTWHMEKNKEFASMDNLFIETEYMVIEDEASEKEVINWWNTITKDDHEGIVIKSEMFIEKSKGKLIQPAIKVRGRKYLHIIYGMDYLEQENLNRLKKRKVGKKQKLALREFALGIEGIQRFVNGESIERVNEYMNVFLELFPWNRTQSIQDYKRNSHWEIGCLALDLLLSV
ncbi:hypothetical protein ACH0B5_17025 [Ureibacillus sp. 179-F W5.1 NHS]|uniref:hypothetical protein n=1 Tax=Ureibacillus sp. 179-F W5.1 NHS TaxID=3374297 RepID=UPI00387983ED